MGARRLVDLFGMRRQFVVEAVEEDALAARHQPLLVRAVEIEMPGLGIDQLGLPHGSIPGSGASITTHLVMRAGILRRQRIAHHVADVVRDQIGLLDLQRIHHAGDVQRLILLGVAGVRMSREPHAAQIRHDHQMAGHQLGGSGAHMSPVSPKPCSRTTAGPLPPIWTCKCGAVGGDLLSLERSRKWLDGQGGRGATATPQKK